MMKTPHFIRYDGNNLGLVETVLHDMMPITVSNMANVNLRDFFGIDMNVGDYMVSDDRGGVVILSEADFKKYFDSEE